MFEHRVRVTFGEGAESGAGLESDQVESFEVTSDMLELADTWTLSAPLTPELWARTAPDQVVRIFIDDSQVLDGFIDERERAIGREGSMLTLAGRDKGGRLVDESAEILTFTGESIGSLAAKLVAPWFAAVTLSNARNRALVRGRGRRLAKVSGEPLIVDEFNENGEARNLLRKVQPGETTAKVLSFFLERAELLGWSTADGREFVIGRPNYSQAPQYFFFVGEPNSARWQETNIVAVAYRESVSERYQEIMAVGTNRGDKVDYGPNVTRRTARTTAKNVVKSSALSHRKRLIVVDDDLKNPAMALARAEREMRLRDSRGVELELEVAGFGQALGGDATTRPALYACDTMARYEDEELGVRGDYLVTRCRYARDRDGERTSLSLVPKGTELVAG